jgi:NADH-quinone oxidoreductase subunit C
MSDDTKTPPGDGDRAPDGDRPSGEEVKGAAQEGLRDGDAVAKATPSEGGGEPAEQAAAKPKLTDEEKAAKIAAAKAKAAAKKAAAEGGGGDDEPPKPPWEDKPVPPIHEDAADDEDVVSIGELLGGAAPPADRFAGDVTATVPRERIVDVCRHLKDERGYGFLVDLTAVDWPEREAGRFDVVYWLHRHADSKRLRLVTAVPEDEPIDSVEPVWKTANWMEREVYDMFGIVFSGHPGLERILTWEGFNGHPLRKDFPVEGIDTGAAIYPEVYPPGGGPEAPKDEGADAGDGGAA